MKNIIPIGFEVTTQGEYKVILNGKEFTPKNWCNYIETEVLPTHKLNTLEFCGDIVVNRLVLDQIDTEYFVHHGFTENSQRGNASKTCVKYFFKTPIWSWYLDWKQNDNSVIRELSKAHQGFIPL